MGFFDGLNKFLNENIVTGPAVSGPETNHIWYSPTKGEIRKDSDYLREFSLALYGLRRRRHEDSYLESICSGPIEATIVRIDKDGGHEIRWSVKFAYGKSITVWLITQEAVQLTREGKTLQVGYSVIQNYEEKKAEEASQKERERITIENRRKELAAMPPLESFLGVKFGDDAEKYKDDDNPSENDDGFVIMQAKTNHFLDFTGYLVFASKFDKKVAWVACFSEKSKLGDSAEYMRRVSRLLEQKYGMHFIKDDDALILPFYDAEKWDPHKPLKPESMRSVISLFFKDDLLCLVARDEALVRKVKKQNAMEKKATKKDEDKNALEAL